MGLWSWLFGSGPSSQVEDIIKLMEARPAEWEFGKRCSISGDWGYEQLLTHTPTKLTLYLRFNYSKDIQPCEIKFHYSGQANLVGKEKSSLISAVDRLRHSRFNVIATNYLKLQLKAECACCKEKLNGWAWVCKCQAILDQECYTKANICPSCGGTLVSNNVLKVLEA